MSRTYLIKLLTILLILGVGIPILFTYYHNKSVTESEFNKIYNDVPVMPVASGINNHLLFVNPLVEREQIKVQPVNNVKDNQIKEMSRAKERDKFDPPVLTVGKLGNYETVQPTVSGPGEMGRPVNVATNAEVNKGFADMGFNKVVSEMISLNRTIPDTRPPQCKYWNYAHNLPTASVILIFLNEGWTTLLRTVHSIYNRSPPHLLKEIILLDDYSNKPHLGKPLEEYVKRFHGKVKVFRNKKREGLIRARTNGARHATGDVIIFLDSHCEVNANWLPPILAPILSNPKTLAVPVVDGIDDTTFEYRETYRDLHRGIFEWGFYYKENPVPEKERLKRTYETEPYRSPTHAGGLFAIGRKYFFELGAYDPLLETWGGENYELSFKLWQCGGEQVWVPCSHVGHIYSVRIGKPYRNKNLYNGISNTEMNYLRVVEVWFDPEHKEYFYTRIPQLRGSPVPNISEQLAFKRKYNCKSFKWFMDNIAYDVYDKFPPPPPNVVWGQFMLKAGGLHDCWDAGHGDPILYVCHFQNHATNSQIYRLNKKGQIGNGERCIAAERSSKLQMVWCTLGDVSGPWSYDFNTHLIKHESLRQCVSGRNYEIKMAECNPNDEYQEWIVRETFIWKLDFPT